MPVTFETTEIEEVLIVKTGVIRDSRGYFSEAYSEKMWAGQGFHENFVQDNISLSAKGTLRGMHYQINPEAMGKLVRCVRGGIFDVAVDLRRDSATFGKWVARELSEENALSMWVPAGFAHGFLALQDDSLVHYKCTAHHAPEFERSLHYACPTVGIAWPMEPTLITPKDAAAPRLEDAEYNF
ncbi:MAG: dTDP-4-dehydrorhamnose 3,5-epimerase [Candidatus Hydrogenedentes bacterium]|nr:dTDP-4-dehydrorhamnose 3,5-epimerase [Candidatus Hydrogenedentota bacterium]